MASSTQATAPKATTDREVLEALVKKAESHENYLYGILEKLSIIELRQSRASGDVNDSLRHVHQWVVAESATVPKASLEQVVELVKAKKMPTYYEAFIAKDLRRGEWEMYKLYQNAVAKNAFPISDNQHAVGECLLSLPSSRAMIKKMDPSVELEPLPEILELFYQLAMPMTRSLEPVTYERAKSFGMLPSTYPGKDLSELEAQSIFNKMCGKCPEIKVILGVPINETLNEHQTWHGKLMLKIKAYNEHKKQVTRAELAIGSEETNEGKASTAEQKKAEDQTKKAVDKFWSACDPSGMLKRERAEKLYKQWKDEAKQSKESKEAKDAKEPEAAETAEPEPKPKSPPSSVDLDEDSQIPPF